MTPKWAGIDHGLAEKRIDGRIYDLRDGCLLFEVPPEYRETVVNAVNAHGPLVQTLKQCLQQMREASELLEMFPDDYGDAINAAHKLLVEVDPLYAELDAKITRIKADAALSLVSKPVKEMK